MTGRPGYSRALENEVLTAVDDMRDDLEALCGMLVAARSVNPPGDTRDVAGVVAGYLTDHGTLKPELVAREASMPNVVTHLVGAAPGPHLVINVHLDTMDPGEESAWSVPIFELTRRDNRLYGLGIGNMKGAVAAATVALVVLAAHRDQVRGRLSLVAVSDECVFGDNGAAYLLEHRADEVIGNALICGEGPGYMRLGVAEKGLAWYRVQTSADGGHASRARTGETATARLAAALVAIDSLNDVYAPPVRIFGDYDITEPEARRLSANIGTITAGTFISQLATRAHADVDIRIPIGISIADVDAALAERLKAHPSVTVEPLRSWEPNWSGDDSSFVRTFAAAAADVRGLPSAPIVRLPASDASRWRSRGVPAVCYGPQPTLSAGIDDYVEIGDVIDCAKVYALAALRFLSGGIDSPPPRSTS